ncbi:uncharacterized protein LOC117533924 isoform X2 [Gymnodraco acuticeps]|uniref:Uncharacterized protein LOC117533924 isoform X2 n=1 Tax=Gymnodraco acuticeps TaxID=8218 RepID=A0A6P8SSS4_GYMAC|nr:uncharacterized protein LOC117533924 isoform X2 [Gymnodraco acuticeps]
MSNDSSLLSVWEASDWSETSQCPPSVGGATFLIVAYSIVIAIGLLGNAGLVFIIARQQELRNVTNILIANLSCSDILMCVVCLPVTVIYTLMDRWVLGEALCDSLRAVCLGDGLCVLAGSDRSGAPPADPPSHRLVPCSRTLLPGCGLHLAAGWRHLHPLPLLQHPHQRPLPEHQPACQPLQGPCDLHGALALRPAPAPLHHLSADLPVRPAAAAGAALLPEDLPPPEETQGHVGSQPQDSERSQDQRHAALHRGSLRSVLAAAHRLQHSVRLAPPGAARLPAQRRVLRLPPHRHGLHLHQPRGVRLPQQQLPEGAEGDAAALPVWRRTGRDLRELPSFHGGQRGHD